MLDSSFMLENVWLLPFIPAVSFVLILAIGKRLPFGGAEVGIASVGTSFALACLTGVQWIRRVDNFDGAEEHAGGAVGVLGRFAEETGHGGGGPEPIINSFTWWQSGEFTFSVGTYVDGLTVMMLFVVSFISLLVHIYSTEYVKGDVRFTHFFGFLSLFTASMLLLLVSSNTLQFITAWELVGVCSFALIGHWWEEKPNSDAALKAFLTNRVGDIGLLIGMIVLFFAVERATGAPSFDFLTINSLAADGRMDHLLLLVAACCLMAAVASKSGQFPLHTWLPDAMAGPTPVSALIHAATMVVAGVFMIARLYPVFFEGLSIGTSAVNLMAVMGGTTVIIGGLLAFVQKDIKKVLAYSTVSQLGYMVMALGVGAWTAGVFHLFTHAFFKACLFLGAGSMSHAAHHSFNMVDDYGGLRKYMPTTFATFMIGTLALVGLFPFAGFWSKDEILAGAANGQGDQYTAFLIVGTIGAVLTMAYMTRAIWYCFFSGEYRGHGTPHESPKLMTIPLQILAGFAIVAGFLNFPGEIGGFKTPSAVAHLFQDYVEPTHGAFVMGIIHADFDIGIALASTIIGLSGFAVAYMFYFKDSTPFHGLTERNTVARKFHTFLVNKYYLDHLYTDTIAAGTKGPLARAANWANKNILDGLVNLFGTSARDGGRWMYKNVDRKIVDGAANGAGMTADGAGGVLRNLQNGKVQNYAVFLFAGATFLAGMFLVIV